MSSLNDLMLQLRSAAKEDYATIAKKLHESKQFLYDLRDGRARYAYSDGRRLGVDDDPRYRRLAELFDSHGLSGDDFLTAARRAQAPADLERLLWAWQDAAMAERPRGYAGVHVGVLTAALGDALEGPLLDKFDGGGIEEPPEAGELLDLLIKTCPREIESPERRRRISAVLSAYSQRKGASVR